MNIPNMITMVRLVMTVFVFVLLELHANAPTAEQTTVLPWMGGTKNPAAAFSTCHSTDSRLRGPISVMSSNSKTTLWNGSGRTRSG